MAAGGGIVAFGHDFPCLDRLLDASKFIKPSIEIFSTCDAMFQLDLIVL